VEGTFGRKQQANLDEIEAQGARLQALATELNTRQVVRIKDSTSKTRLSILFYGIVGNAMMLSKQNLELLDIFEQSFGIFEERLDSDG